MELKIIYISYKLLKLKTHTIHIIWLIYVEQHIFIKPNTVGSSFKIYRCSSMLCLVRGRLSVSPDLL